jgi:hypothetical protein
LTHAWTVHPTVSVEHALRVWFFPTSLDGSVPSLGGILRTWWTFSIIKKPRWIQHNCSFLASEMLALLAFKYFRFDCVYSDPAGSLHLPSFGCDSVFAKDVISCMVLFYKVLCAFSGHLRGATYWLLFCWFLYLLWWLRCLWELFCILYLYIEFFPYFLSCLS